MAEVKIRIKKYQVPLDPDISIYHVDVERGDGGWEETCPTREHLDMFLRGVQAGCEGYVPFPEIPETAEPLPSHEIPAGDDLPF